ncbi:MAG: SDR family oxidoreductase [Syntrophaceae bacterium]
MRYLVTGGAGFIGSNLAEALWREGATVRILDNFSTGKRANIGHLDIEAIEGDIRDLEDCRKAARGMDFILHKAALASVPASVADPLYSNAVNITGTLNMLTAAREAGTRRFVLASSSSVYGDGPEPVKTERSGIRPLSPYALGKLAGEEYCRMFFSLFGLETVCLRYFNVFGPRQDPNSEYAAVIPKFITALLAGKRPVIFGDGLQTRDFIFIGDVVRANLLACSKPAAAGGVFNIACDRGISLLELLDEIKAVSGNNIDPVFEPARLGDVRHSRADISLARERLDFEPAFTFREAMERTVEWFRGAGPLTLPPLFTKELIKGTSALHQP